MFEKIIWTGWTGQKHNTCFANLTSWKAGQGGQGKNTTLALLILLFGQGGQGLDRAFLVVPCPDLAAIGAPFRNLDRVDRPFLHKSFDKIEINIDL